MDELLLDPIDINPYNDIFIDSFDNNLEINDTLLEISTTLDNLHLDIFNNSINTLEISIVFIGLFIGLLLSILFGVVAFSD